MPIRQDSTGGPDPAYRAYEIGEDDRVVSSEVIDAASDEEAKQKAHQLADGRVMELWDRGRLVVRIRPDPR